MTKHHVAEAATSSTTNSRGPRQRRSAGSSGSRPPAASVPAARTPLATGGPVPQRTPVLGFPVGPSGYGRGVTETAEGVNWTTDPVELPGVDPVDPPSELVEGRLWQGGCPVDFAWVRATGIDVVLDLADPDAYPPSEEIDGLVYLKCPLVDTDAVPEPGLTLRLAHLVAGLVRDGHQALVHCTFGRNRSGLLATLVVRDLLGLDGADSLAHVRERRPGVANNEAFERWLTELPPPAEHG